jgi:signal peptidase II
MKKVFWPSAIIGVVLVLDQWLKYWVKNNMFPGEEIQMAGQWFFLHFVENNGMAFGVELGGQSGKIALTLFRIILVIAGVFYLSKIIRKDQHPGFISCVSLIIAGALGNIIDSVFNGIWYARMNDYPGGWFEGKVIDMLYFPIIRTDSFIFFSPVFNLADAAISCGVMVMILFQNRFFPKEPTLTASIEPMSNDIDDIHKSNEQL